MSPTKDPWANKRADPLLDSQFLHQLLIRSSPDSFAEWASDGQWKAVKHLRLIARTIVMEMATAHAASGGKRGARIIVNLPPRHGKSLFISKWLPIWFLEHNPDKNVMMISYDQNLAENWGREVRDEFDGNPKLTTRLREDVKSVSMWKIKGHQGGMKAAGIGSGITGFGFSLGIIDDAIKDWTEAHSPTTNRRNRDWFDSTFMTRQEPGAHIIVLMHRWTCKDLCGYLMTEHPDPWKVIKIPAIAGENDILGRQVGEAIWEERVSKETILSQKAANLHVFMAMYQQEPPPETMGCVYDHYSQADNCNPAKDHVLRKDLPLRICMDFNVNPGCHMEIGQNDSVKDLTVIHDEITGDRMKTDKMMDAFEKWIADKGGWQWPELYIYGDRSGRHEGTATSETDYQIILKRIKSWEAKHGWNIKIKLKVPFSNPPVKDRVDTVNESLRDGEGVVHLLVHPRCKDLLRDFEEQQKDEDGQPDKSNDLLGHAGDAVGYKMCWIRPVRRLKFKPQRAVTANAPS